MVFQPAPVPNTCDWTHSFGDPLVSACISGNDEVVWLMLDNGADPNVSVENESPLALACERGFPEIVELLLHHGADPNMSGENGRTPLGMMCNMTGLKNDKPLYTEHLKIAEVLLKYGADINRVGDDGWTPLMLASYSEHPDWIEFLLKHKCDVTVIDSNGWSALDISYLASEELGDEEPYGKMIQTMLLKAGCKTNKYSMTDPLWYEK